MRTFSDTIRLRPYHSRAFDMYFGGQDLLVLDLETTGLYPRHDRVMLAGFVRCPKESDDAEAVQFFAETPDEEPQVLEAALREIRRADVLVTYNGQTFDLPFLKKRASRAGFGEEMTEAVDRRYSLDLYQVLRKSSPLPDVLDSLSQKSVEKYAGIDSLRDDRISGYDSLKMYAAYQDAPEESLLRKILLHNHDDIAQLARLIPILRRADLHDAMFRFGFPASDFLVRKLSVRRDGLHLTAAGRKPVRDFISFPSQARPYHLIASAEANTADYTFPSETIPGQARILDAEKLLAPRGIPESCAHFPGFQSGYLILEQNGKPNILEINSFVLTFLREQRGILKQ